MSDQSRIAVDKMRRSFERVRRLAGKALEATSSPKFSDIFVRSATQILEACADVLEAVLKETQVCAVSFDNVITRTDYGFLASR